MEAMKNIPDGTVDMILCDLPYGTTNLQWDVRIPMEPLWREYRRVTKDSAAIVLTAQQPFATDLIYAARKLFRYELIWEKPVAMGFLNANRMPLRAHENLLVFYKRLPTYNPQMTHGKPYERKPDNHRCSIYGGQRKDMGRKSDMRYPRSVVLFGKESHSGHPTEKPVRLFEWLVLTYTNPGDLVLDSCIGSGTTAIACEKLGRRWMGIEQEETYCKMAQERLVELVPEEW